MNKNIFIVAGEASGDIHAARVIRYLKVLLPDAKLWGVGGNNMEDEGVELIEHVENMSLIGLWEILKSLKTIWLQFSKITKAVETRKPDFAILIDYPGFNMLLARKLSKLGVPVIYYIVPQFWAWGSGRIKKIKKFVDKALTIFKFEEEMLSCRDINAEFVGHPLVDHFAEHTEAPLPYTSASEVDSPAPGDPIIALLPGSRKSEITQLLPLMLEASEQIQRIKQNVYFVIAENSNMPEELYSLHINDYKSLKLLRIKDDTINVLKNADMALVASGTATLESALCNTPLIITYKISPATYYLAKAFMKISYFGLVNIISEAQIVPELIQADATSSKLAAAVIDWLDNPSRMEEIKINLKKVAESLGEKGASKAAAEAIYRFALKEKSD